MVRHRPRSIRAQLLVIINVVLGLGLTMLLVVDYRRNVAQQMIEKKIALHEAAQTLATSVRRRIGLGGLLHFYT